MPGLMWWPGQIPAGAQYHEMMSHIDCWSTLAKMVGLTPPPHGAWIDNNSKPIYFDSIDNSEYFSGRAKHSARRSWVYIDGENFLGAVRMSPAIQIIPNLTSHGSTCGPRRTRGWAHNSWAASVPSTISPWIPSG